MAGVEKPGIIMRSLCYSPSTFALFNDTNPTRVHRMIWHRHYATSEIYVEEGQLMLEGAEGGDADAAENGL